MEHSFGGNCQSARQAFQTVTRSKNYNSSLGKTIGYLQVLFSIPIHKNRKDTQDRNLQYTSRECLQSVLCLILIYKTE